MKKLLFIPIDYKKGAVQQAFMDALQTKFDTIYYTGANSTLLKWKPDVIFQMPGAISVEELTALKKLTKARVIQWTGDCREDPLEIVMRFKGLVDRTFLACGIGQKEMYERELEHPVMWLQHAASMFLEPKQMCRQDNSIAFVGNYYDQFSGGNERNRLCELLDAKYGDAFFCYGSWSGSRESVPYHDTPWIYNNAYISISANIFNDVEGYWSNRPYDICAAGSCCLMRWVPGIEKHFTDMEHCVMYRSNEEALEKIEMLLKDVNLRNRIALSGCAHVLANHTHENRVKEIWDNL